MQLRSQKILTPPSTRRKTARKRKGAPSISPQSKRLGTETLLRDNFFVSQIAPPRRFLLGSLLKDGKSKIYSARSEQDEKENFPTNSPPCVIKVSTLSESSQNEVKILAALKHPNIISFYGGWTEAVKMNLLLERAPGGDLCEFIEKHGPLPESNSQLVFGQILNGVNYLHSSCGIVHLDLKLDNILLMEKVETFRDLGSVKVKLTDFEFSTRCDRGRRFTEQVGTEEYWSPQVREGNYCPFSTDIWSLGVSLYVMCRGVFPFADVDWKHFSDSDLEVPKYFSEELTEIITRMLAKEEARRPSSEYLSQSRWIHKDFKIQVISKQGRKSRINFLVDQSEEELEKTSQSFTESEDDTESECEMGS